MGIIFRQTVKSTAYIYLGAVLGFVTSGVLFPTYLEPEQIGVLSLIVGYAVIFAQVFSLGFLHVTVRFFPHFKTDDGLNNGFALLLSLIGLIGSILFSAGFFVIRYFFFSGTESDHELFSQNIHYILPFTLAILWFNFFDTYNAVLLNSTYGTFLKEFIQRLLILFCIVLFIAGVLDFTSFTIGYFIAFLIPTLASLALLVSRKNYNLFTKVNIPEIVRKEGFYVSGFGIVTGLSNMVVTNIDRIMINEFISTAATGIYVTAFYFGVLISMPYRALTRIAPSILAQAFKEHDLTTVREIYQKSTINQFIIACYLFLGLVCNTQGIFSFLPSEYAEGYWVIIFSGLGNVVIMAGGLNTSILANSRYFRYNAYFTVLLVISTVLFNFIFIPFMGITGAALATVLALILYNLVKWYFINIKFKAQPYNKSFLKVMALTAGVYFFVDFIPYLDHYLIDIPVRSLVMTLIFIPAIYFWKVSQDFNQWIELVLNTLLRMIRKR